MIRTQNKITSKILLGTGIEPCPDRKHVLVPNDTVHCATNEGHSRRRVFVFLTANRHLNPANLRLAVSGLPSFVFPIIIFELLFV